MDVTVGKQRRLLLNSEISRLCGAKLYLSHFIINKLVNSIFNNFFEVNLLPTLILHLVEPVQFLEKRGEELNSCVTENENCFCIQ